MRPEYIERYKADQFADSLLGLKTCTSTIRLPGVHLEILAVFATTEDDTVAGLLREGILRVIDDRLQDEAYMAQLSIEGVFRSQLCTEDRINALENLLKTAKSYRQLLNDSPPNDEPSGEDLPPEDK